MSELHVNFYYPKGYYILRAFMMGF